MHVHPAHLREAGAHKHMYSHVVQPLLVICHLVRLEMLVAGRAKPNHRHFCQARRARLCSLPKPAPTCGTWQLQCVLGLFPGADLDYILSVYKPDLCLLGRGQRSIFSSFLVQYFGALEFE